jgi:enoyl-CoA hydratase
MSESHIHYETLGPVARIMLARPDRSNAQSAAMLDELDRTLQRALEDAAVRVIVLGGQGQHFSAGHDLKDEVTLQAQNTPEERYAFEDERYLGYCLRLWDSPKPIVAQVQGACIAAGFMLANMCDLIVASDDAFFADPVVNTVGAAAVEVLIHPWVLGLRQAKHFLYTGGRLSAQEALACGMVNQVVPRAELEASTMALANKIAESSSFALRLMKRSLNRTADLQGLRSALNAHFDTHQLSHMSTEVQARQAAGFGATIQSAKARAA